MSWEHTTSISLSFTVFVGLCYRYLYPRILKTADAYRYTIQKTLTELREQLRTTRNRLEHTKKTIDQFELVQSEIANTFRSMMEKHVAEQMHWFENQTEKRLIQHNQNVQRIMELHHARIEELIQTRISPSVMDTIQIQPMILETLTIP
jgi:F0F1-type ATP synthase membrane subunit b/b'